MLLEIKYPSTFIEVYGDGEQEAYRRLKFIYGENIHQIKTWNKEKKEVEYRETFLHKYGSDKKPGEKLKDFRKAKGLSVKKLSHLSGIAESSISQMENLKRTITVYSAKKLAKAMESDFQKLM